MGILLETWIRTASKYYKVSLLQIREAFRYYKMVACLPENWAAFTKKSGKYYKMGERASNAK